MENISFAAKWGQADRPTTMQSTSDKKERNGKSEKKKKKKDEGSSCLSFRGLPQVAIFHVRPCLYGSFAYSFCDLRISHILGFLSGPTI